MSDQPTADDQKAGTPPPKTAVEGRRMREDFDETTDLSPQEQADKATEAGLTPVRSTDGDTDL